MVDRIDWTGILSPHLRRKYRSWSEEHRERGCGGNDVKFTERLGIMAGDCRCTCPDHRCGVALPPLCPTCGDTGIVGSRARTHEDAGFGKAQPCPECNSQQQGDEFTLIQYTFGFLPYWFDEYRLHRIPAGEPNRMGAEGWLTMRTARPALTLHGGVGSGKTHAAIGCGIELALDGVTAVFTTAADLLDAMRSSYKHRDDPEHDIDQVTRRYTHCGLLILDDLGAEKSTEWAQERLFKVLNYRYMARMLTIITTNLDPSEAEIYKGDRVWSRIFDAKLTTVVNCGKEDHRREEHR